MLFNDLHPPQGEITGEGPCRPERLPRVSRRKIIIIFVIIRVRADGWIRSGRERLAGVPVMGWNRSSMRFWQS